MDSSLQSLEELSPQTFKYEEHSKRNHTNHIPSLKVHWNQAQKPPEILTNHKSMKLYELKPPKHRKTSTTNLHKRRTHEEHTKNTKNVKNKEFLTNS